ncbi:hypothetical protein BPC006_I3915 [Burkholderia pseudomallei BPC006]|nr:hypothetical protein BPC006_I3915 [Burkholderia pseudomallei BPC006]
MRQLYNAARAGRVDTRCATFDAIRIRLDGSNR